MKILIIQPQDIVTEVAAAGGMFGLAVNHMIPIMKGSKSLANLAWTYYETKYETPNATGLHVAGNNVPPEVVQPAYYPVATLGAECGVTLSNLTWAENNLIDFEYVQYGAALYFVTGVLNSSQTQANDPFAASQPGFLTGVCWAGSYVPGLMPF